MLYITSLLLIYLFKFLIRRYLLHIMMVFAIHWHESAIDIHMSPPSWISLCPDIPPHPIPLGCPRALTLGSLHLTSYSHWLSVLHMVMYMFQCYSLKLSHPRLDWSDLAAAAPSLTVSKSLLLSLSLLCSHANSTINTIFLESTYMH